LSGVAIVAVLAILLALELKGRGRHKRGLTIEACASWCGDEGVETWMRSYVFAGRDTTYCECAWDIR